MYGEVGGRTSLALVLGAVLAVGAVPAQAADLGGDCCTDLEERIAELEATTARKGNRKVSLTVGGYINEALLFWDDGRLQDVYQGTNDVARSRFRFQGDARIDKDWSAGYLLEIGLRSNRLNRVDQFHARGITTDPEIPSGYTLVDPIDVRHSAWFIQHKDYGRLWVGWTDQATERITEITTSNTNLYLKHYGRWNNSFILRRKDNDTLTLGNPPNDSTPQQFGTTTASANFRTWGNLLPQTGAGEGVPGEGDRFNVVKFDSAEYHGFVVSAAWGEDDFWDAALRYAGEHHGFRVVGGIGYAAWSGVGSLNARGCSIAISGQPVTLPSPNVNSQFDYGESECSQLGLSGSAMHIDTGLFVTGAYGIKWDDNRSAAFNGITGQGLTGGVAGFIPATSVDDTDSFYSVTIGIEQKLKHLGLDKFGKTTIFADYEHYDTGAIISGNGLTATGRPRTFGPNNGFGGPGGLVGANQLGSGAETDVWGAGFNQNFENAALDVYVAYRWAESELTTTDNGAENGGHARTWEFVPIQLLMAGSRIQF